MRTTEFNSSFATSPRIKILLWVICLVGLLVPAALSLTTHAQTLTATIATGNSPEHVAVNLNTNKIYVTNTGSASVTVIDGATNNATTVAVEFAPIWLALNPNTNKIYVANDGSGSVTVIDGATNNATTVAAGAGPLAVNPTTNKIYVAKGGAGVTVIDLPHHDGVGGPVPDTGVSGGRDGTPNKRGTRPKVGRP